MSCSFFGSHRHYIGSFGNVIFSHLGNICCFYIFALDKYCMAIAIFGIVLTTMDIYSVLADGPVLSNEWRMTSVDKDKPVSAEKERDIKLVTAVMEWTIYCCLFMGTYYSQGVFLLPWIWLRLFILLSSLFVFFTKMIKQKPIMVSMMQLLEKLMEVHNLLYVTCLLKSLFIGHS